MKSKNLHPALWALVMLIAIACSQEQEHQPHVRETYRIVLPLADEIAANENLVIGGWGAALLSDVKGIAFTFEGKQRLLQPEMRDLFVRVMERFLREINRDEQIRPFLAEYPFPASRVDLRFSFYDEKGAPVDGDAVAFCYMARGMVHYDGYDAKRDDFVRLGAPELYETAKRITTK